jgi:hypothetical protein
MNRRKAVRNLVIASGGLISLPFWMEACRMSDKNTHLSSFSRTEQEILAKITDTIIPGGGTARSSTGGATGSGPARGPAAGAPGALSVGVDKFLQKLIDDCYEKPVQDNVKKQLAAMDASATAAYGKSFTSCLQQQREEILMKGLNSANKDEKDFYALMKNETIRGFNTSQKVMEDYLNYKVAPGHYYGCVNVKV